MLNHPSPIKAILAATAVLGLASVAPAAIAVTYSQEGNNVVFEWSGSWDVNSVQNGGGTYQTIAQSDGDEYLFAMADWGRIASNLAAWTQTEGSGGIFSNLAGNFALDGSITGQAFGIHFVSPTIVYLYSPQDYIAGTNIEGALTIPDTTIAALGLTPTSFDFGSYGQVSFQPVPEPAAACLLGLGGLLGAFRRRRIA